MSAPPPTTIRQATGWCSAGHEAPELHQGLCAEHLQRVVLGPRRRSLTRWWRLTAAPWLGRHQDPLAVYLLAVAAYTLAWLILPAVRP